jgi:hypothetical protein
MSKTIKNLVFISLISILSIYGLNLRLGYSAIVSPVEWPGNPTCQDVGYPFGLKVDPPASGTYYLPDNSGSVTVNITGPGTFDWSSTFGIDAVIAKGGPKANVYFYDPESTGDTNLVTPTNPQNGKPYGLSHITFCYDVDPLQVSKTATTSFTRTWSWNIEKSASTSTLLLADGQIFTVNYSITVNATSTDSDWNVSGEINITNPSDNPSAIISSVDDVLSISGPVSVDCGAVTFPYNLPGGQTLTCTYSQNLSGPIDQTNTVTVNTSGLVPDGSASTSVVFSSDPTNEIDECATINDTNPNGPNGWTVCSGDVPTTTIYTVNFGKNDSADVKLECGLNTHTNTSTLTTNDTNTSTTSSWTINATVACTNGCTLTQGYWKTHNNKFWGGASKFADPTWNLLGPLAENSPFFSSGSSWFQIFWMPPSGGNAYLQLAHKYMAAKLNILKGASAPSSVLSAISWAENIFFPGKTPSMTLTKTQANQARYYASILASYNEGLIGPGHCSE